jgi:hypothetical protein
MAYIGREPQIGNFQICDAITVVDAQAAYTMQVDTVDVSPESANHMIVSLNGVIQKPTDAYTVSGSTITFASALETGDVIDFIQILGNVLDLGVPSDGTVTTAKIVDANVTLAKLSATGTKDATTFLRGDNTFAAAGLDGWSSSSGNLLPADAAKGIYLGVASATAANLLDDYEEGTWTLAVTGQGADGSQVSRYTKIGNRVFIDSYFTCDTDVATADESQPMQGLPFSAGTSTRAIINCKFIKTSAVAGYGGAPTLGSSSAISLETYGSNFIIRPISTTETNTSLYYRQDIFENGTIIRLSGVYETTA